LLPGEGGSSFDWMKRSLFTSFLLLAGLLGPACYAQNGQVLLRVDEKGNHYYEIPAENPKGTPAGRVTPLAGTNRTKFIIVSVTGYWMVADQNKGAHINAEGHDIGGGAKPAPRSGPRTGFRLPSAPPFSLIGMWESYDHHGNHVMPLSKLFYIGKGGKFRVPLDAPFGTFYDLRVRYFCNDDLYTDNAGALHVYQSF
jgi:hypothetical protein